MKQFSFLAFSGIMSVFWLFPNLQAAEIPEMAEEAQEQEAPVNMVTGEITNVEGDWCVLQDTQGKEWKIQIDDYTTTIGQVMSGVTIMAMVEPNGHAKEVKVLQ